MGQLHQWLIDYQTNQTYLPHLEEEEKKKINTDLVEEIQIKYSI